MYTSPSSHIALIVIEPTPPYKIRLRCSCGWKQKVKGIHNLGIPTVVDTETWWNVASIYAQEKTAMIAQVPQKTRVKNWIKGQHPPAIFLDHLYYDSIDLAKMITEKLD